MAAGLQQRIQRRGLALPAFRIRGGYFASRSAHDTAWGDLMLAVFTPIGGRFMNRGFGSGMNSVLYEPNLPDLASQAEYVLRDTAALWVPHIVITQVLSGRTPKKLQLKTSFHLVDDDLVEDRLIELDNAQIVRLIGTSGN